jgi:predicted phosphoadenosine phosphosulfate sulfurtransferase
MNIMLGTDVLTEAVDRMSKVMVDGHRVCVSFSAGKDSGICLEVCLIAAEMTGYYDRYPEGLDVVMRDEEIMYPGTFEYAERVAQRPEINFHWVIAGQPIVNVYDRRMPYFWVFDDRLDPSEWVRTPPDYAKFIDDQNIENMNNVQRMPPLEGKMLVDVIGLRVSESRGRLFGIHASKGYLTQPYKNGTMRAARPIYDWKDGDVWKAVHENKWDYNRAYDTMHRLGVHPFRMRIAPPTLTVAGVDTLGLAARAWPRWFDKVCERLPGVRLAANYGSRAISADRRQGESWQDTFERECIETAPDWIAERAILVRDAVVSSHRQHATGPVPEISPCWQCINAEIGSWQRMTRFVYNGDPFALKTKKILEPIEPEYFREGAGVWGGTPTFT